MSVNMYEQKVKGMHASLEFSYVSLKLPQTLAVVFVQQKQSLLLSSSNLYISNVLSSLR